MNIFSNPSDQDIEQATSEDIPYGTIDFVKNLDIVDKIKSQKYTSKQVIGSIKKRLIHKNPNVQLLSLSLLDTLVKNCGLAFHIELCQKDIVDQLFQLTTQEKTRQKTLELVQFWALSFKQLHNPQLSYMITIYEQLKLVHSFPTCEVNTLLLETQMAPPWSDSDVCMRCRSAFTTFNRKHHCRNCGDTFCQQCSSKQLPLLHLGITDPVRVCDTCHFKIENNIKTTEKNPNESSQEDEDLQKAIQASLRDVQSTPKPKPTPATKSKEDEDLERAIQESLKLEEDRKRKAVRDPWSQPTTKVEPVKEVKVVKPQKPKINGTQLQNIHLFAELVEQTAVQVQQNGIHTLDIHALQSMFAQVSNLHSLLTEKLGDVAHTYKQLYDMNNDLQSTIREYDQFVLRRFRGTGVGIEMHKPGGVYQPTVMGPVGYGIPSNPVPPPHGMPVYSSTTNSFTQSVPQGVPTTAPPNAIPGYGSPMPPNSMPHSLPQGASLVPNGPPGAMHGPSVPGVPPVHGMQPSYAPGMSNVPSTQAAPQGVPSMPPQYMYDSQPGGVPPHGIPQGYQYAPNAGPGYQQVQQQKDAPQDTPLIEL